MSCPAVHRRAVASVSPPLPPCRWPPRPRVPPSGSRPPFKTVVAKCMHEVTSVRSRPGMALHKT
eukprot:391181-Alexandrium_andersonii.AAC.1